MPIPQFRNNLVNIVLFAALTCYLVFSGKANMFFLIYIFWWDEFLKTIFAVFSFLFQKNRIDNRIEFRKKITERFFMLFVYFIFIVVIFGFVLAFSSDNLENSIITFQILLFHNLGFNLALILILIREITNLAHDKEEKINDKNLSFGALITLHVSIILGVLVWTLASGQFKIFKTDLGELANQLIILPFIVIKLIFDIYQFNQNNNLNQS